MKRKVSAKAQQIAKRSQKESLFVFASLGGKIEQAENSTAEMLKSTLSSYGCEDCGTAFVSQANSTPFCVTCGSHKVEAKAEVKDNASLKLDDRQLASVACNHCKSSVIMTHLQLASMKEFSCTTCGSALSMTAETENPALDAPVDEVTVIPGDDASDNTDMTILETAEDSPIPEIEFEEDEEEEEDVLSDASDLFDDVDGNGEADVLENYPNVDEIRLDDVEVSGPADDFRSIMDTMVDDGEEPADEVTYSDLEEGEDLMDAMEMDDTDEDLEFAAVGSRLVAMKGYVTVATINQELASSVDIYSRSFRQAVAAMAKKSGLRNALLALRFKPVKVKALTEAAVATRVDAAKQEASKEVSAAQNEINESVALAAAGLARNQLAEFDNPLRAKLVALFASHGIRGAEKVAANFCLEVGDSYATTLMEAASQLREQGSTVRKALAATFKLTRASFDEVTEDEEDGVVDDSMSVTSSLQQPVRSIAVSVTEKKPAEIVTAANILQKLNKPLNLGGYNG